jgi:hypothetical protein
MDKVQKLSNFECYTPSSEPFRIYIFIRVKLVLLIFSLKLKKNVHCKTIPECSLGRLGYVQKYKPVLKFSFSAVFIDRPSSLSVVHVSDVSVNTSTAAVFACNSFLVPVMGPIERSRLA